MVIVRGGTSSLSSAQSGALPVASFSPPSAAPPVSPERPLRLPPLFDVQDPYNLWRLLPPANDNLPLPWWVALARMAREAAKKILQRTIQVGVAAASAELGVAILFGVPIAIVSAEYLRHPERYPGGTRPRCGEKLPEERQRLPEWKPLFRPSVTSYPNHLHPQLTDAERQQLIEWLSPEKYRGGHASPEGRPFALPSDPERHDSFGAPESFRNGTMTVPRHSAMPQTERALPDLQQKDNARLVQGDLVLGHRPIVGDRVGKKPEDRGAHDFLTPRSPVSPSQGSTRVPDIRMGGRPVRAQPRQPRRDSYAQQYREANASTAGRTRGSNGNIPTIQVHVPRPSLDSEPSRTADLKKWDAVLKDIYQAWPKTDGRLQTGPPPTTVIQYPIRFEDGPMTLRTILRRHSLAVERFNQRGKPASRIVHPASYFTQEYLLWALQRASGVTDIRLDRNYNLPGDVVEISLKKPDLEKPSVAEAVLREVWPKLPDPFRITNTSFQDRGGRHTRVIRALEAYWKGLKVQLSGEGKWSDHIPPEPHRNQSLQLMHLRLFGRAMIQEGLKAHYLDLPMPIPHYTTLEGILQIGGALSRLPFVRDARMFPSRHEHKKDVVVLVDGSVLRYETIVERLTEQLALAKLGGDPRTANLQMDDNYPQMAREDLAAFENMRRSGGKVRDIVFRSRTVPNEATRKAMYEWLLRGQKSTVVRRRRTGDGTDSVPVFWQGHQ